MAERQLNLSEENRPVRHYSLKHRLISFVSRTFFANYTYTVRHGLLRGMKRKGGLGWLPAAITGDLDTAEHRFLRELDLNGLVIYDVGAFEGLRTMFFAQSAKHVVCYEPNPRNHARLLENLELNGIRNVTVRPLGVGATPAKLEMAWSNAMPGGGSVDPVIAATVRSAAPGARVQEITVTTIDLDREKMNHPPPDLVKIDIEGWELEALEGARTTLREYTPALYLEMHGDTMREKQRKTEAIVVFLEENGYSKITHMETGLRITAANSDAAAEGHLYATAPRSGDSSSGIAERPTARHEKP